jgi:hypothetical protein
VQTLPVPPYSDDRRPLADIPPVLLHELRREVLYDLEADPRELVNVAAKHPEMVRTFRARIRAEQQHPKREAPLRLEDSDRERLRALGYVE